MPRVTRPNEIKTAQQLWRERGEGKGRALRKKEPQQPQPQKTQQQMGQKYKTSKQLAAAVAISGVVGITSQRDVAINVCRRCRVTNELT